MAQILTLTFKLASFGALRDRAAVSLSLRQRGVPFVVDGAFDANAVQSRDTVAGEAKFKAYASPDLVALGFADAYYVLECKTIGLRVEFWVPRSDSPEFQGGDLSKLVALVSPGGTVIPGGGAPFYSKSETNAAIVAAVEAATAPLRQQNELLTLVANNGGALPITDENGVYLLTEDGALILAG